VTRFVLLFNAYIDTCDLARVALDCVWDEPENASHWTDLRRMCFVADVLEGLLIEEMRAAGSAATDRPVAGGDG
jgi:hypothetical protein